MNRIDQNESEWGVDWSRLQSLCLSRGWDMGQLAREAGVSRTTLHHWQSRRTERPRLSTVFKLADALGVKPMQLMTGMVAGPAREISANRAGIGGEPGPGPRESERMPPGEATLFDRQTNWCVQEVCERFPELFAEWTEQEWDELFSSFGVGGELNEQGVREQVEAINQRRTILYELQVVLETHLAEAARGIIHSLYEAVQCPERAREPASTGRETRITSG